MSYINGRYPFTVFEGIDCSGKTSLARALAGKIGATYYVTPPAAVANATVTQDGEGVALRRHVEERKDLPTRMMYYLFVTVYASSDIQRLLQDGPVVCDKYVYSTLAYHRAMDPTLRDFSVQGLPFLEPDVVFHLRVSREEQERRAWLRQLENPENSGWFDHDHDLHDRVDKEYADLGLKSLWTDGLSIDELVDMCLDALPVPVES